MKERRTLEFRNSAIKPEDLSMIVDVRNHVLLEGCYIENLDISTTNPNVCFIGCEFINSELVTPNDNPKAINCIFRGYKRVKKIRYPVRVSTIINGYHTPVCKPKFV